MLIPITLSHKSYFGLFLYDIISKSILLFLPILLPILLSLLFKRAADKGRTKPVSSIGFMILVSLLVQEPTSFINTIYIIGDVIGKFRMYVSQIDPATIFLVGVRLQDNLFHRGIQIFPRGEYISLSVSPDYLINLFRDNSLLGDRKSVV